LIDTEIIERGNTKRIKVLLYDEDGYLVNADTNTCKIAITFQDGTVILAATAMTYGTTGTYTYLWTPSSTIDIGIYSLEITATFGSTQAHVNREQAYVCDIIGGE